MIILFQPPEGIKSVGEHINLEISIYLQRFPHHQRTLRRLIFDYLLKRECCITGKVIIDKSRCEVSLLEQDIIENVS